MKININKKYVTLTHILPMLNLTKISICYNDNGYSCLNLDQRKLLAHRNLQFVCIFSGTSKVSTLSETLIMSSRMHNRNSDIEISTIFKITPAVPFDASLFNWLYIFE